MKIYAGKTPLKTFFWKNTKYKLIKVEQHNKDGSDKTITVLKVVKQNNQE